jgi:hypothetical protein
MALVTEKVTRPGGVQQVFVYESEQPAEKYLTCTVDRKKSLVTFHPRRPILGLKTISIEGFNYLPPEFHEKGYIKAGVAYYLAKKFEYKQIATINISKSRKDSVRKTRSGLRLQFSYDSFHNLKVILSHFNFYYTRDRSLLVDDYFHNLFPRHCRKPSGLSVEERTRRLISQLDESIIEHLDAEDAQALVDFFAKMLRKRGMSSSQKRRLFESAKLKIDEITVVEVVKRFETMLSSRTSENRWGEYLRRNLFLIDARYIDAVPQLNVQLGGTRTADFGLIDSQGYLDIFEIKLPTATLLARRPDRGNYYWSTEAIRALVQAEKYSYNAARKAASLAEDIKREKGLVVDVIRPRALLLIGHSAQLDSDNKKEDFRVLRQSLKNVEVILYDELLDRLKLQKGKIYIE